MEKTIRFAIAKAANRGAGGAKFWEDENCRLPRTIANELEV